MTMLLKAVRRETAATVREQGRPRSIVVELHAGYLTLRAKGLRRSYTLDYHSAYVLAVRAAVEQQRREKAAKRGKR